ncbi:MAG TPA: zinc ribbon domain-containing protein [Thermoplasmata archaeon]|nr:zinc ribbon domain-containing protein [Thermoplasmata archaeon]
MKCVHCGSESPEGMKFCGLCGGSMEAVPVVSSGEVRSRQCVGCGRVISWDALVCQYCGHDFRGKPVEAKKPNDADALLVGAILSVLAGIVSMLLVAVINMDGAGPSTEEMVVSSMVYVFAVLGVIGGLSSLSRYSYPISVLGAACCIFGPGFFFGIPALVLTARSSSAFDQEKTQRA